MLLAACGNGKTESRNKDVQKEDVQKEANTGEIRESITAIDEVYQEEDAPDVNSDWYVNTWYRGTLNTNNILHIKEDSNGNLMICSAYTVIAPFEKESAKVIADENVGNGIQYVYSDSVCLVTLNYFPDADRIILVMIGGSPYTGTKYDFSDAYEYDSVLSETLNRIAGESGKTPNQVDDYGEDIEGESTNNDVNYFYDGQRFECFETKSGEDMVLTIRLFYDSDENGNMISDMPSMYKGVLNNGIEFWFEYYESTSEYIIYEVNCADGSTAYLKYNLFTSEIELFADDGLLNDCGGSYIGLPDSSED